MKKLKLITVMIVFLSMSIFFKDNVFALSDSDLISVGTGRYAITVSQDSSLQDIINVLGEPKLVTESAYGGYAYAFYTDDSYSNYLYIETLADGKIVSYGSVDPSFKTNSYSYGDNYNYDERGVLHGCIHNNNGKIDGGIFYNKAVGGFNELYSLFESTYMSNPTKYLKGLSQQSVLIYNALCTHNGYETHLEFNEDFFYINEQFKEFGTSIREYLFDLNKQTELKSICNKSNIELANNSYYIMNPAWFFPGGITANFGDKNIAIFDYNVDTKSLVAITVSEDIFRRYDPIELTTEEKSKLVAGRAEYAEAIEKLYEEGGLYDVEPQSTDVTTLTAGELKDSKKQGITSYVNAIRVAAGLPKLSIDEDAFLVAQHISTLISYRLTELGLPIQHIPPQPDGLSDEYYKIAVQNEMGFAENLGYSSTASTERVMMRYINMFLEDGSEDPQVFSHRARILNPSYTKFGFGISPYTFSNEFGGTRDTDIFLEAWPAEGITFLESVLPDNRKFKWTARFLDKYTVTSNTTVTVKCLNTEETWEFNEETDTSSVYFKRYTTSIQSINNKVAFFNSQIVPENGYVYEITVHNLKNDDTNSTEDYTYRSVFEYADEANIPSANGALSIEIDSENMYKVDGRENVYNIPIGVEVKLSAKETEAVLDNKVTWTSSNENVKVTQNGIVLAEGALDEEVTITVTYDGSETGDSITLIPFYKIEQIKIGRVPTSPDDVPDTDENSYEVLKGESVDLQIEYIPNYATEEADIEWKVISKSSESVEYSIDDPDIRKYIAVDILDENNSLIRVTAVDAELNNNKYILKAYARGISGTYTGIYNIDVNVPLDYIRIKATSDGVTTSSEGLNLPQYVTIDFNEFYEKNGDNILDLATDFAPENTTVDRTLVWNVDNANVLTDYDVSGKYRIDSEGQAVITAYNKDSNFTAYMYVDISSELESVSISSENSDIKLKQNSNGEFTAEDTLKTEKYPSIDTDKILYKSSNEEIATVDENGKVTFKDKGIVTITAYSQADEDIKDEFTYNVSIPATSMYFNYAYSTQYVKLGESIQYEAVYRPLQSDVKNYIKYTSSNPSVATVDKNGIVNTKSTGVTTITATLDGKYTSTGNTMTSYYTVRVHIPVESVSTEDKCTVMIEEEPYTLTVEINPENTTDDVSVRWESSDTSVLTVDSSSGKITPIKSGKATVTAIVTATNGRGTTTFKSTTIVTLKSINDPKYLKGDLDRNGVVNSDDAAIALDLYRYGNESYEDLQIGDMDENGLINSDDAALILDVYRYGL